MAGWKLSESGSNKQKSMKKDYMNNLRHSYKPQRLANVKSRPIYVMEVKMILKARSQYWPNPGYLLMDCHGVGRGYPVSRFPLSFVEMAIKSFIRSSEEHWASQICSIGLVWRTRGWFHCTAKDQISLLLLSGSGGLPRWHCPIDNTKNVYCLNFEPINCYYLNYLS